MKGKPLQKKNIKTRPRKVTAIQTHRQQEMDKNKPKAQSSNSWPCIEAAKGKRKRNTCKEKNKGKEEKSKRARGGDKIRENSDQRRKGEYRHENQ